MHHGQVHRASDGNNGASDLKVRWLGHATTRIDVDGFSVLTDPVLVDDIGPIHRYAAAPAPESWSGIDLVVISHLHRDHLDLRSLRRLGRDTRIIVPAGAKAFVERHGFRRAWELAPGETREFGPIEVTATAALHSGFRPPFGPRAVAVGYVIRGSQSVYFAGDTGFFPGMAELAAEALDVAMVPVGGWGPTLRGGHLNPTSAAEAVRLMAPRMAIPIHWGTFWPRGLRRVRSSRFELPGEQFAALTAAIAPDVEVVTLRPGEAVTVTPHLHGSLPGWPQE